MRKVIPGFERYEADSDGYVVNRKTGRELHGAKQRSGYIHVELQTDDGPKQMLMHRVVALAFVDNPDSLPMINHKDEDPGNNRADNLEWCTAKYNQNYGTCAERRAAAMEWFYNSDKIREVGRANGLKRSKPVVQISKDGAFIARYSSGEDAHKKTGVHHSHLLECCAGKRKTAGGYVWKYERSDDLSESL